MEFELTGKKRGSDPSMFTDCMKSELFFAEPTVVWIGDPCYAPELNHSYDDDHTWSSFCDFTFGGDFTEECSNVVEHRGVEFLFGRTAHGDGCYRLEGGGVYASLGVDAGLLSVIPAGAFGLDPDSGKDYGGAFVEVQGRCWIDGNHSVYAGRVTVHTQEICRHCKEAVESGCACERCEWCHEVEDWDCCCDKCEECGCPEHECECERCECEEED